MRHEPSARAGTADPSPATSTPFAPDRTRRTPRIDAATAYSLLQRLLAEAGLRTYRIEPGGAGDAWHISAIHCTAQGAWQPFRIKVDAVELRRALEDERACRLLVARLGTSLAARDGLG
jgi:hypothetical protein